MSGLTIYKASAGSGKTFAITREYIHLLFRDPDNYRRILGVTFTNKATAEMKSRIVAELDKLANGSKSDYAQELSEVYKLNGALLKQKASFILSKILHDYSHFSILTIDSFFQRIIRAFAREIGFYQGFDIELDQNRILSEAVDQMIFDLDSNPKLKDWLVRFAENRILEGANWNVNRDIENLGQEVFKEKFNEVGEKLLEKITDKEFLEKFSNSLSEIKKNFETQLREKGREALSIIRKHNLANDDFKGKSRSIHTFFEKLSQREKFGGWEITPTIRNHHNEIDFWLGKDNQKNANIRDAFHEGLNRILEEIISVTDTQYSIYQSAVEVQKHLYVLGVVSDLIQHIKQYTSGKNLFMISDTARFLRKLIGSSDAPFVYERTGTFIRHFMIDEFQDTSTLQWQNFLPLILNSLSENNENWVVGDVKQSIYRWRNSDWTILSEKIFTDLYPYQPELKALDYNWRSSYNIVSFNNSFFKGALNVLLNDSSLHNDDEELNGVADFKKLLSNAYQNFLQLVPPSRKKDEGFVKIEFIPKTDDKDIRFYDQSLEKLPKIIQQLQDKGYLLRDIAILVRTRNEGDKVSEYLLKYIKQNQQTTYRYDVLSNDSLLLRNSEVVKWMISVFTCIVEPDNHLNKAFSLYEYCMFIVPERNEDDLHSLFSGHNAEKANEYYEAFFSLKNLRQRSVYELSEKIVQYFHLSQIKGELPFIQAFQDMLQEYSRKGPVDLSSFLQWWDENKDKRVINMPENQYAIRLMTLHTAKGLEFKIVIIPFGDWAIMKAGYNSDILWCNPKSAPFDELELLPVNLSKGLQNTIFSPDYYREKALSFVDNLNLLYVAFTRAIDGLYVIVPESTKDYVDNNISNLISLVVASNFDDSSNVDFPSIGLSDYWKETENSFVFGNLPNRTDILPKIDDNIDIEALNYISHDVSAVVRQVIQADDYLVAADDRLASQISAGRIMHEVFQRIITIDDVDDALLSLLLEGKISDIDQPSLSQHIKMLLKQKKVNGWFSTDWHVFTEAGILLKDGSIPRPDRVLIKGKCAVVIDYKFGETEQSSHTWQVRNYMKHIRQMKFTLVEGFLWYVNLDKVVPVTPVETVQGTLF